LNLPVKLVKPVIGKKTFLTVIYTQAVNASNFNKESKTYRNREKNELKNIKIR
jgi:hypothetical protein